MLKHPLKQKYKPIDGIHNQVFKDSELTKELVALQIDNVKKWIDAIVMYKIYSAQYGNVLQFIEENNIQIEGYTFKKTRTGGYWT